MIIINSARLARMLVIFMSCFAQVASQWLASREVREYIPVPNDSFSISFMSFKIRAMLWKLF